MKFKFLIVLALTGMVFAGCNSNKSNSGADSTMSDTTMTDSSMVDTSMSDTAKVDTIGKTDTTTTPPVKP